MTFVCYFISKICILQVHSQKNLVLPYMVVFFPKWLTSKLISCSVIISLTEQVHAVERCVYFQGLVSLFFFFSINMSLSKT